MRHEIARVLGGTLDLYTHIDNQEYARFDQPCAVDRSTRRDDHCSDCNFETASTRAPVAAAL